MQQKHRIQWILLFACLCILASAFADPIVIQNYWAVNETNEGWKAFQAVHPDVRLADTELDKKGDRLEYVNTDTFVSALLTQEFHADMLGLKNVYFDNRQLMKKGFLLDLSDSETLRAAVERMHPLIRQQVMHDGRIYALPTSVTLELLTVNKEVWEEEGFSISDLPDTITEWFDFLEAWCDRREADPRTDVSVFGPWDTTVYSASTYPDLLTEWVIRNYIMQSQFAGEPLQFDETVLLPLLRRSKTIGTRLYQIEKQHLNQNSDTCGALLMETLPMHLWPRDSDALIYMRMNEQQPKLIRAYIDMTAVSAATAHPALCVELLEHIAQHPDQIASDTVLLYQDAVDMKDPNYEPDRARAQADVNRVTEQLKDEKLETGTREELEKELKKYQKMLASYDDESKKYIQTPAQVADYKQHADQLFFSVPGVFAYGTDAETNLTELQRRFAAGQITAEQMLKELNRMARMVQLENQ